MPRGGRRAGASAPKGNANAMRTMNYSRRATLVVALMLAHPDKRELGQILIGRQCGNLSSKSSIAASAPHRRRRP